MRRLLSLAAVALTLLVARAEATVILDQEFDPGSPSVNRGLWSSITAGQTFTVGVAGTLSGFDVWLQKFDSPPDADQVLWELQSTASGFPDGTVLASGSIPFSSVPPTVGSDGNFVSVDVLAHGIAVTPGDLLAIVISGTPRCPDPAVRWGGDFGPRAVYPGGQGVILTRTGWMIDLAGRDQEPIDWGFRTRVETSRVPAPTTIVLLLTGAAAHVGRRRRS